MTARGSLWLSRVIYQDLKTGLTLRIGVHIS